MTALRPYSTTAHGGLTSTVRTFTPHARRPLTSPEGVPDQVAELAGSRSLQPQRSGPRQRPESRPRRRHSSLVLPRRLPEKGSCIPQSQYSAVADPRGLRGRHCEAVLNCQPQAQRSLAALAHQKSPGTESGNRHQDGNEHGGTGLGQRALGRTGLRARRDGGDRLLGRRRAHGRLQRGRQPHPLHPPTSHETTHRRLTHHIGARYRPGSARLVTGRCCP